MCCCSVTKACPILCHPIDCSMAGFPVLHCLPEFAQIHVHWVGDAIQSSPFAPISCPQSFPASRSFPVSWLFASGGRSIGASASALVLPVNSGLISFRIDWFDLFAVQGTLKHHNSKASILQCSAFFMVWLSHLYMTTRENIALTIQTSISK